MNNVVGSLSRMRYQMMTNKPLEPFPEDFPNSVLWNTLLDEVNNYANDVKVCHCIKLMDIKKYFMIM